MKVKITQEHIDKGEPVSAFCCPVALAVQDATGDAKASVSYSQILTTNSQGIYEWMYTPVEVQKFLARFDHGKSVEPFEFTLKVRTGF